MAPFTENFDPVTDDIFTFQYVDTSALYYRTSPKKYRLSGVLTYYNSGATKTQTFTDVIIDPAVDGGLITTFDYGKLELTVASGGSVMITTSNVSTTKYATKVEITKFDEYR